eukprot:Rhum_TRINITY_DN15308_c3_g2::Rhum_TRINITY_DN15308_c3_g2_i1::g.150317::m.150317
MKASVVWAFAALCAASVEAGSTTQRVLFIGNSYTYVNDLPNLYKQLATSLLPGVTVTVDSDTGPGRRLEQAAQSVTVQERLAAGNFDFLVLQDAAELGGVPTVWGYASVELKKARLASEAAIRDVFTPAANKAGATVVFFVTWAQRNGETGFLGRQRSLSDGYAVFADIAEREACGRVVQARAGEVYKKVYEFSRQTTAQPSHDSFSLFYQLYWPSTTAGSYATAWALFTAITGNAAPYKAGTTFRSSLSEELAAQLAGMAQEVWTEHASVASEIKAIQGYYPTSTYVVRGPKGLERAGSFVVRGNKLSFCQSLWGGADPNYEGDVYDLTVQDGAVYWKHESASVTSVSEFAATLEWSNGVVFANNAVCRGPEGSTDSPATSAPPTASPPTPAPTASPDTPAPAPTASPGTAVTTASPGAATTAAPTVAATSAPTAGPSTATTAAPTVAATPAPTASAGTAVTTASPGTATTAAPTVAATSAPTASPSMATTAAPTVAATPAPTASPGIATTAPTVAPTASPGTAVTTASPGAATTATSAPTASTRTPTPAQSSGRQDSSDSNSDKTWIVVLVAVVAVVALGGVAAFFFLQRKKKASPKFSTRDVVQKTPFPAAQLTEMADHPPASLPCDPCFE